jgi:hypothetical protein
MFRLIRLFLITLPGLSLAHAETNELLIRLQPEANSPVVSRVIATEKVVLDAAPAEDPAKAAEGWQQLELALPLEGYVPVATLSKNFEITENTPVRYLPTPESQLVTYVESQDQYEVVRAEGDWATVKFVKPVTGYFLALAPADSTRSAPELSPGSAPKPPVLNLEPADPTPVAPGTSLAFDPNKAVGMTDPSHLPPENVIWKSAPRVPTAPLRQPRPRAVQPPAAAPPLPEGIMVGPAQTQAREAQTSKPESEKPLRLLTGILVREINRDGPAYPIRLKSPEGRLIAYVDFSAIFVPDLDPFLGQRVYLRGQIFPLKPNDSQLVIYAEEIRLAQ